MKFATSTSPNGSIKRSSPIFGVMNMVVNRNCNLSSGARLVAIAIAARLNHLPDPDGKHSCWMGERDIAARTGFSVRTVRKKLRELREAPEPMFAMRIGGVTRGKPHKCYGFELVVDVQAFLRARSAARMARPRRQVGPSSARQAANVSPALVLLADTVSRLKSSVPPPAYAELKRLLSNLRRGEAPEPLLDPEARRMVDYLIRSVMTGPHARSAVMTGLRAALAPV